MDYKTITLEYFPYLGLLIIPFQVLSKQIDKKKTGCFTENGFKKELRLYLFNNMDYLQMFFPEYG